jgi:hypothetical protein
MSHNVPFFLVPMRWLTRSVYRLDFRDGSPWRIGFFLPARLPCAMLPGFRECRASPRRLAVCYAKLRRSLPVKNERLVH